MTRRHKFALLNYHHSPGLFRHYSCYVSLVEVRGKPLMFKTPPASRLSSPERPTFVDTPVHRSSRRLLGLSPEFSALSGTRSARGPQAMASANAAQVTFQQPREPNCFHGEAFEDVDDWLDHFERVARFNQWNNNNKLHNVYFSLKDGAETWFLNNEASMRTWEEFREKLLEKFSSTDRCDHAMRLLDSRIQKPNESVAMFAEDMARLFKRADPAMAEAKKLRYLMHGVKEQLFAGLVRNPPQTVQAFIKEATAIERALQDRSRQYNRHTNHASSNVAMLSTVNERDLRDLVRTIVQEELRKLKVSSPEPVIASASSIAEIVREELRQTLVTPEHSVEAPQVTYAGALRRRQFVPAVPRQEPLADFMPPPRPTFRPQVRKTDVWRTVDNRPLCYHCGEPGHVIRRCPYREIGLPGFSPTARRPRIGERPAAIEDYLANRPANAPNHYRSRSPSPARPSSPCRSSETRGPRSASPLRGN